MKSVPFPHLPLAGFSSQYSKYVKMGRDELKSGLTPNKNNCIFPCISLPRWGDFPQGNDKETALYIYICRSCCYFQLLLHYWERFYNKLLNHKLLKHQHFKTSKSPSIATGNAKAVPVSNKKLQVLILVSSLIQQPSGNYIVERKKYLFCGCNAFV